MKFKRIFSLVLGVAILVASVSVCSASDFAATNSCYSSAELKSWEQYDKAFLEDQSRASEVYEKLIQSFGTVGMLKASDYPEYYGGAYINNEGKLVVHVKGDITSHKQDFIRRCGTDEIIFEPCKYSYTTLNEIMDNLNAYKLEKTDSPIIGASQTNLSFVTPLLFAY